MVGLKNVSKDRQFALNKTRKRGQTTTFWQKSEPRLFINLKFFRG